MNNLCTWLIILNVLLWHSRPLTLIYWLVNLVSLIVWYWLLITRNLLWNISCRIWIIRLRVIVALVRWSHPSWHLNSIHLILNRDIYYWLLGHVWVNRRRIAINNWWHQLWERLCLSQWLKLTRECFEIFKETIRKVISILK